MDSEFPLTAMKTRIGGAKIACLDMNLQKTRLHLGVHITIDDPEQLEAIRKRCVDLAAGLRTRQSTDEPFVRSTARPTSRSSVSAKFSRREPTSS